MKDILLNIGVILLNLLFVLSVYSKVTRFKTTSKGFQGIVKTKLFELPIIFCYLAIIVAIIIELICPIIIQIGVLYPKYKKYSLISTIILIIFTVIATYLYHFPPYKEQYYAFIKNVSIIGGLLVLMSILI